MRVVLLIAVGGFLALGLLTVVAAIGSARVARDEEARARATPPSRRRRRRRSGAGQPPSPAPGRAEQPGHAPPGRAADPRRGGRSSSTG
ncbi:MAG TPA: hypothetical protein VG276_17555 [Actinomycetes bacterium]|jgi:hypothetical protein|nr:hypothetical protein [Actinomycetes bacterium]